MTAVHRFSAFFVPSIDFTALGTASDPAAIVAEYMAKHPTAIWWAIFAHAFGAFVAVYLTTQFTKVGVWKEGSARKSFYPALIVSWFYLIAVYLNTQTVPTGTAWLAVDLSLTAVASAFAFKLGGGIRLIEPGKFK